MRRVLLVVCLACGCAPVPVPADAGADAGAGPTLLRAATFNVHRFFDSVCDTGNCEPGAYEEVQTEAAVAKRGAQLASTLDAFDVDVVALQEVESQPCIDAILARTAVMTFAQLGETGAPASVDVAIFSRVPIEAVVHHQEVLFRPDGSETSFARDLLEVHVTVEGTPVVFFAAHFKSKNGDDPGRRLAEAQAARRILDETAAAHPDALVVLGGDLNDTPESPPLQALLGDGGVVRAAAELPEAEQATYVFNGSGQAIDHLLQAVTPAAVQQPGTVRTWRGSSRGFAGSDHFALSAAWRPVD